MISIGGDIGRMEAEAAVNRYFEVVSRIRHIMRDIGDKCVSPEELNRAKNAFLNGVIFSFKSADKIVVQQMIRKYNKLPEDYLDTYRHKVNNAATDSIKKAAGMHVIISKAFKFSTHCNNGLDL